MKPNKQTLWLKHFLDDSNPKTFLNRTASARAAGYSCKNNKSYEVIGCQNLRKLKVQVDKWLEEYGFSETALKLKLVELLHTHETKFFNHGEIKILVPALRIQLKALDMAFRMLGWYDQKPENRNIVVKVIQRFPYEDEE